MASTIVVITKVGKKIQEFINTIDNYLGTQNYKKITSDNSTIIYFNEAHTPPNLVRGYVDTIRKPQNFGLCINHVYYTVNLTKG